ncbi:polyprenyl synthetase family protein [Borreliella turdi]|uniref:polyprenyl synthetase family protein n=1 Tax=Borreliella turdi TaxID=57863 RepID=UPI002647314C|nr:polyprenyl synthetase family protein [Borreliella turdi]WKC78794.1 polyprenyl synthetase family protein [Borreliella turdi]
MQNKLFLNNIEKNIDNIFSTTNFLNLFKDKDLKFTFKIKKETLDYIKAPAIEIINRGGKRIRPMIMILLAYALGLKEQNAKLIYKLSLLLELPHSGSLIIDDIEDNSIKRRGKPAIHLIYGIDNSINAGNLIYFLPVKLIERSNLKEHQKLRIYENFFTTLSNLHLGQGIDIKFHNESYIPSIKEYITLVELKTASLFGMASFIAAILTNNEDKAKNIYSTFLKLGVYFQIIDDIKNIKNKIHGKEFGDDLLEGKKSLPIIYFLQEKKLEPKIISKFNEIKHAKLTTARKEIFKLKEMINSSKSIKNSTIIALKYLNEFKTELDLYPLTNKYKNLLIDIVDQIKEGI